MDETAKNKIRVQVLDISHVGCTTKGMLSVFVPGYDKRTILFSTPEVAEGIGKLMLADFNGKKVSFTENEHWTTVHHEIDT